MVPNLGAGSVGAAIGARRAGAVIKSTQGLPPVARFATVMSYTGASVAVAQIGLSVGNAASKNMLNSIASNSNKNINNDTIPSPPRRGADDFINSVIESGDLDLDIPIVSILHDLISLNYVELFVICLLIYLFIYHYVNKYTSTLNQKFRSKLFSYFNYKSKQTESNIERAVNYNERFIIIMLILTFILLLIIKIGHIFISVHLFQSIDSYVQVYNSMKK